MYKKLHLLLFLTISCFSGLLYAQRENVWILQGHVSGGKTINFNNGIINIDTIPFTATSRSNPKPRFTTLSIASVCDLSGKLLFYTEGERIWNREGNIMPNANGVTGIPMIGAESSTINTSQGSVIVPMVNHPDKYYVFSLTGPWAEEIFGVYGNLYYSVVDMTLDGGRGDVVPEQKGILIDSSFTHSMYATIGDNCNYWLVLTAYSEATKRSDVFKSFEITEGGVNKIPVVSKVGQGILKDGTEGIDHGYIKISPDGKKLVRTKRASEVDLELYDFSRSTGKVSNPRSLIVDKFPFPLPVRYEGLTFSPNSTKLYGIGFDMRALGMGNAGIHQFDLTDTSLTAILNSRTLIDSFYVSFAGMKNGPDGKIYYWTSEGLTGGISGKLHYFTTIDNPDLAGTACGVTRTKVTPEEASATGKSLGDYHEYFQSDVPQLVPDTLRSAKQLIFCANDNSLLLESSPNNSLSYKWNDLDTSATKRVSEAGTYWVVHGNDCHYVTDTFVVTKIDMDPIINVLEFELSTTQSYKTYQWLFEGDVIPGAEQSSYSVTENGNYQVIVTDTNGCIDTSEVYRVTNAGVGINDATSIKQITMYPNPAHDVIFVATAMKVNLKITGVEGKLIKEKYDTGSISIGELADGIYLLHIRNANGALLKIEKFIKVR